MMLSLQASRAAVFDVKNIKTILINKSISMNTILLNCSITEY